ncbi:MAG: hypothetical protein CMJ69_05300 [Planctomycetaceae bacterium]|nr:hypothetical protein [Planctomycetaceae bacterium]
MKTAGFQYINVLGISLLVTAFAWTSLLGARDTGLTVPRMVKAARLFERQGRLLKAAEMYRRVLRVAPGNAYAAQRLEALRAASSRLMEMSVVGSAAETEVRRVASSERLPEPAPKAEVVPAARNPKQILDSTRLALAKIRKKIAGQPLSPADNTSVDTGKNQTLTLERSPLWDRLDPSLRSLGDVVVLGPSEKSGRGHQSLVPMSGELAAVNLLVDAVRFTPDTESALAAYMMGTRTTGQDAVVFSLEEQLAVREGFARVHVAEALLRIDGTHVAATDALVELVSAPEKEVRVLAVLAMQSAVDAQRDRCIQILVGLLSDGDSAVRAAGALALGGYGRSARVAVPALMKMVRDENVDAARAAGVALRCVFPEPDSPVTGMSDRRAVTHGS